MSVVSAEVLPWVFSRVTKAGMLSIAITWIVWLSSDARAFSSARNSPKRISVSTIRASWMNAMAAALRTIGSSSLHSRL